ncbi:ComEA family DNA-binding protein [Thermophilibacter sp. ZX-H3]|uniref:ComEA family DNA-binding protein n=1 Tax=unclassified Thermophilibacter TaxID=2847308 RepID=UPI0040407C36
MAQRRSSAPLGRLARRYGVVGRGAVAAALVLALLVAGGAAAAAMAATGGVEVVRGEPSAAGVTEGSPEREGEVTTRGDETLGEGEEADEGVVVVHVDGAVGSPGVYELEGEPRVNDAIAAAGGLAEGADTSGLNLAARLADGEKVHVPLVGEAPQASAEPASGSGGGSDGPVNLNTATVEELDELPGVGEATALAIVEDRETNGPFSSPEDLMRVSGIGEKKFAKLEGLVCV